MARDGAGVTGRLSAGAALVAPPVPVGGGAENGDAPPAAAPEPDRGASPGSASGAGTPTPAPAVAPGAAAGVALPPRPARAAALRKLAAAGWLCAGRGGRFGGGGGGGGGGSGARGGGGDAWYSIGPRSFAELGGLLVGETDAPEERKAAWGRMV
jgi:hypothetical protein